MDMMCLMGWYYQEDESKDQAREFFETFRSHRAPFPFPGNYQVGPVRRDEEEHWAIGIQVMRETAHDDNFEAIETQEKWFLELGADTAGSDRRMVSTTASTIDATLHNQFGSYYTSIETFGSDGNAG